MMHNTYQQLQTIQSMLAAGHRSVYLERHSLLLIGLVGGAVAGLTEYIITVERFPDTTQRAVALLIWLGFWLSGMSYLDHLLTQRARQQRDETLPFVQAQITRAWWMLLSMGSLGSFAMFFFGGGAMIYALWIVLLGLGIYLFGLFSKPLVEWIGLAAILLGVTSLASLPYGATHWLAATCFAIGMPLAGWLNSRYGDAPFLGRLLTLLLWIFAVVASALLCYQMSISGIASPHMTPLRLDAPRLSNGAQVLKLEPGTPVQLKLDLESPLLTAAPSASLPLQLTQPLEISLLNGTPDGRFRVNNGTWHHIKDGLLNLQIDRLTPQLEQGQAVVKAHAVFADRFSPGAIE